MLNVKSLRENQLKQNKEYFFMNEQLIVDYKNFLNNGKTERECVEQIVKMAQKNGYKDM